MKCDTKGCRNEMALIRVGVKMCLDCWTKHCKAEEKSLEAKHEGNE